MPAVLFYHIAAQNECNCIVPSLLFSRDPDFDLVQNEFRIDSSRLQPEDKGMMFRLMYFFMSFHHQLHQTTVKDAAHAGRKGADLPKFELGHVLETMDLMSFNLVLREAETAMSEKNISEQNAKRLAECVAVLKEMMHIVVGEYCTSLACFLAETVQGCHDGCWKECGAVHDVFVRLQTLPRNPLENDMDRLVLTL